MRRCRNRAALAYHGTYRQRRYLVHKLGEIIGISLTATRALVSEADHGLRFQMTSISDHHGQPCRKMVQDKQSRQFSAGRDSFHAENRLWL